MVSLDNLKELFTAIYNDPNDLWISAISFSFGCMVTATVFKVLINKSANNSEQKGDNEQQKSSKLKCLFCGSTGIFLSKRHEDGKGNKVFYVTYPYEFTCRKCGEVSGFTRDELLNFEFQGTPEPKQKNTGITELLAGYDERMKKAQEAIDRSINIRS